MSIHGMLERLRVDEPNARVLLDVGAPILEPQNQGVADLWLEVDPRPEIEAAVFVDLTDFLYGSLTLAVVRPSSLYCVVDRQGRVHLELHRYHGVGVG
jgi:hypothetical protein